MPDYVFESEHFLDINGNPAGGSTYGPGFAIAWQNGPLGRGDERKAPNGAFVEHILQAALDRFCFYEEASDGRFSCEENQRAMRYVTLALGACHERTARREAAQVEGTHEGN